MLGYMNRQRAKACVAYILSVFDRVIADSHMLNTALQKLTWLPLWELDDFTDDG